MKKFLIAAIAVLGFTTANAQYTAEKGDIQTSVDFVPFASNDTILSNTGINVSYFLTNKDAIRVGLNFGSKSEKDSNSSTSFGITLGYENHFKTYDRLDIYAGGEIGYRTTSTKEDRKGLTENDENKTFTIKTGGENVFSIAAFTGVNVYVYKKLYLGAEIQFGYENSSAANVESLKTNEKGDATLVETYDPKSSNNNFGFSVRPAIRLGWTF